MTSAPRAIFIRHPESTGNAAKLTKGTMEFPLDAKGKEESTHLAVRIARYKPTVVVSSPLSRARGTAEAIAKRAGARMQIDRGLLPQDFGTVEGTPRRTGEPKVRAAAMKTPNKPMPGGESFNHWLGKADSAMRRVKMLVAKGHRVAVVTHSRNLREAPHSLFGSKPVDPTRGGPEPSGFLTWNKGKNLKMHAPAAQGASR